VLFRNKTSILLFWMALSFSAFAEKEEKAGCRELRSFIGSKAVGDIDCYDEYHHFNAHAASTYYTKSQSIKSQNVKIGSFNLYNLGSTRTEFKNHAIVAKIINKWDIVAAQEILPVIGVDFKHNTALTTLHRELKIQYAELVANGASYSERARVKDKIELLEKQYHTPGYIPLLKELQKLDPSWALILSGSEEGTATSTVFELAGYFYRGTKVKPISNEYCRKYFKGSKAYACTPKFDKTFYGKNVADLFARRPLVGSFQSGNFDFTLLNSHIIHNTPGNLEQRKKILQAAYGVDDYTEIGHGVGKRTFARFAEVKHILNFMSLYKKKFKEQDLILLGDFNLKKTENYWPVLLEDFPGTEVKIEGKTSIALARLTSGRETKGVKNNYDHFIFDDGITSNCAGKDNFKIYNFLENSLRKELDKEYKVRSSTPYKDPENERRLIYEYSRGGEAKQDRHVRAYIKTIENKYTVSRGEIVKRYDIKEKTEDFLRTVFKPQLQDRSYYRFYREIVSDHLPIYMNCNNTTDLD
jgi:hypothetical protein